MYITYLFDFGANLNNVVSIHPPSTVGNRNKTFFVLLFFSCWHDDDIVFVRLDTQNSG